MLREHSGAPAPGPARRVAAGLLAAVLTAALAAAVLAGIATDPAVAAPGDATTAPEPAGTATDPAVAPGETATAPDRTGIRVSGRRGIVVIQAEGLIDPPNARLIRDSLRDANERDATLVVIQLDSPGALDVDVDGLVSDIRDSRVPVAVWVGPSGARARGAAVLLLQAAAVATVAQGATIGPAYPVRLDDPGAMSREEIRVRLDRLALFGGRRPAGALTDGRVGAVEAGRRSFVDLLKPIIGEVIVSLHGRVVRTPTGYVRLSTARVVTGGATLRRTPNQEVRFRRLDLGGTVVHKLTSPSIGYLLLVAGLLLIVFEFYMASIGLAGLAGALALVGAAVGMSHLPVVGWALALVALGVYGFTVDVQAGRIGVWTFLGAGALVGGSLALFGGSSALNPPWWELAAVWVGTAVFMRLAMTAALRSRFSSPVVDREGLVGAVGVADGDVSPEGVVLVDGARWPARAGGAGSVASGAPVRIVGVDGVTVEVESPPAAAGEGPGAGTGPEGDPDRRTPGGGLPG